jgi:hypothetical protein
MRRVGIILKYDGETANEQAIRLKREDGGSDCRESRQRIGSTKARFDGVRGLPDLLGGGTDIEFVAGKFQRGSDIRRSALP